jgi:gamma-glutamyltranspeptidase/glutathione hydrolase
VDLGPVAGPLSADATAAAVFAPKGAPLTEGGALVQPELADTIAQLRTVGVGDMYSGLLAHRLVEATTQAGGPVGLDDLRISRAALQAPITVAAGTNQVAFLPLPADGGLAAAAAFRVLQQSPTGYDVADSTAQAAAARFRVSGGTADSILAQSGPAPALPQLPASTSFTVLDSKGGAVACALTNNNLFGTGRIAPGTGILLAASPAAKPAPLLAAGIAWDESRHAFRAAIGASGQNAAGLAAGAAMAQALAGAAPAPPEPGRANAISCPGLVPGEPSSCAFTADARMAGLAAVGN